MKIRDLCLVLALLWLVGACGREDYGPVELVAEPLGSSDTKLAVSRDSMGVWMGVWTDGDLVNLNGSVVAIRRTDATHAYVDNAAARSVNSVCFPADLCQTDVTANSVTVALPAEYHYHYRISDSAQLLDLPMVGRSPAGEPLQMRHITAALCVMLKNQMGVSLTIDRITVTSDSYQLSGSRTVDMENITSTAAVATDNETDQKVAMVFDREALVLANGEQRKVLIPVPPVGSDNHFTISVSARHQGSRYNYSCTQTTGGALERNVLAYAAVDFSGLPASPLFDATGDKLTLRTSSDLVALSEAAAGAWTLPGSTTKYSECNYRLEDDIDMQDVTFHPIANYTGTLFDGNGHTIRNLTIDGANGYCGLFKTSSGLTIQNLTLRDVTLRHTEYNSHNTSTYFGAFVAKAKGGITMKECTLNGLSLEHELSGTSMATYIGGMVASLDSGGSFTSCSMTVENINVEFTSNNLYFGSLLGNNYYEGSGTINLVLKDCIAYDTNLSITSTYNMYVGGLIGIVKNTYIDNMNGCRWSSAMAIKCTGAPAASVKTGRLLGYMSGSFCFTTGATASGRISVTKNGTTTRTTDNVGS